MSVPPRPAELERLSDRQLAAVSTAIAAELRRRKAERERIEAERVVLR